MRTNVEKLTRFAQVAATPADGQRLLYFSESAAQGEYYITVQGQTPVAYQMGAAPSIVLHQGTTEDWIVENRTQEDHVFHIHQTRFQTLALNGTAVSDPALRDTINVPHWNGSGAYPSVKLRIDFRSPNIVGTFVYHCHILQHEDLGMMAAIQVLPSGVATTTSTLTRLGDRAACRGPPLPHGHRGSGKCTGLRLTGTVQFFDGDAAGGLRGGARAGGRAVLPTQLSTPTAAHSHLRRRTPGDGTRNQSLSSPARRWPSRTSC